MLILMCFVGIGTLIVEQKKLCSLSISSVSLQINKILVKYCYYMHTSVIFRINTYSILIQINILHKI